MNKNIDAGKFLKQLRIDNGELLYDMAKKLNMSVVDISAIEFDKMEAPDGFWEKVYEVYNIKSSYILNFRLNRCIKNDREAIKGKACILDRVKSILNLHKEE